MGASGKRSDRGWSYHEANVIAGPAAVDAMPGGQTWREAVEELAPPGQRHLVTYEGHVTQLTERDYGLLDQGSGFRRWSVTLPRSDPG